MGVDFSGGNAFMPQHGLDGSQVGASLQELRGKAVAEGVRADVLSDAGLGSIFLYIYEERDAAQPFAPSQRDEHEVFFAGLPSSSILISPHPDTHAVPIPRATTAA